MLVKMTSSKHIRLSARVLPSTTSQNLLITSQNNLNTSLDTTNTKFTNNMYPKSLKDVVFNHKLFFNILLYLRFFDAIKLSNISKYFSIFFKFETWKSDSVL